jgi:hypothetical protein
MKINRKKVLIRVFICYVGQCLNGGMPSPKAYQRTIFR